VVGIGEGPKSMVATFVVDVGVDDCFICWNEYFVGKGLWDWIRLGLERRIYIVSHLNFPNMMGYEHPKIMDTFMFGWILLEYIVHPLIRGIFFLFRYYPNQSLIKCDAHTHKDTQR